MKRSNVLPKFDQHAVNSSSLKVRAHPAFGRPLLIITQALAALLLSCGGPPLPPAPPPSEGQESESSPTTPARSPSAQPTADKRGTRDSGDSQKESDRDHTDTSFELLEPEKLDPTEAYALIDQVVLEKSFDGSYEIPVIQSRLTTAHYVEILRCRADYQFTLPDGRPLESLIWTMDSSARDALKWAWNEAKGDPTFCRVVSLEAANSQTFDAAAQPGRYIYAINPCLQMIYVSEDAEESCSYRISLSHPIEVQHGLASEAHDRLQRYLAAESMTAGVLAQMRYNAEKLVRNRALCERAAAVEQRSTRLWNGLVELASFGISAAVSASAPGLLGVLPGKAFNINSLALSLFGKTAPEVPNCSALSQLFVEARALAEQLDAALGEQQLAADGLSELLSHMH